MQDKFWERYRMAEQNSSKEKYEGCQGGKGVLFSEADTFIEFCFERKCGQMKNGMDVLNEWRYHKGQYSKITDTTMYDFQHFSRHDASHSISILESIELVVGEKRIVALSRGDLWLLMEAAYSHDLGMALTGEDLSGLWQKKEFKEYILDCLNRRGVEQQTAAGYYKQMDNLIQRKAQMDGMDGNGLEAFSFDECWPAKLSNYVEWLVCDFIRKQHGERNQRVRKRIVTLEDSVIPYRLYECVVKIAALHTEDYLKIFDILPYEEKGIGAEKVHPRFAAAMLRLGDVLDTDNNRFSSYALEHMIEVPPVSLSHLGKHKAIDMIQISTKKIKVSAMSDNVEVCKEAGRWFASIDKEVEKLICYWNKMVPHKLKGCVLQPSDCRVYRGDREYDKTVYKTNYERHFEVNKQELVNLLIGSNIYDTKLDFIREYLQNAMDASKMQLWQDIQAGDYDEFLVHKNDKGKIDPHDLPEEVYSKYKVKLKVEMQPDKFDEVIITIEDSGIGIEKECLDVISNLGSGWKKRKRYGKYIPQMPGWMKPTGGFGIGIQSAFMMTDTVRIETKTREESMGRCIRLENPDLGGLITTEDSNLRHNGTIIKVKAPWGYFLQRSFGSKSLKLDPVRYYADDNGIFSDELIENHVVDVIRNYVKAVIPDSIIPIYVGAEGFRSEQINGRGRWRKSGKPDVKHTEIEWKGRKYIVSVREEEKFFIWDCVNQIDFEAEWREGRRKPADKCEQIAYYKNVRSTNAEVSKNELYNRFNIYIDIMGFQAREVLNIHRNKFSEAFHCEKYVDEYIKLYLHIYSLAEKGKLNIDGLVKRLSRDVEFQLFRIVMWDGKEPDMESEPLGDAEKSLLINRYRLTVVYNGQEADGKSEREADTVTGEKDKEADKAKPRENQEIDINKVEIRYTQERVMLGEFLDDYKKIFRKEDSGGALLLQRKDDVPGNKLTAMLPGEIYRWIQKNMVIRNGIPEIREDARDESGIMIPIIETGYYEGLEELLQAIVAKEQLAGQYYTLFAGDGAPELKKGIAKITFAKQDEKTKEGEKKFYERSFDGTFGQAVFSADRYTDKYKELYVSDIPYGVKEKGDAPFLISPVTKPVREIVLNNEYLYKTKGYALNPQDFVELVTKTDSFSLLVSWVAKYATDKTYANNREQVKKRYEDYLRDMHAALDSRFGYDNKK